MDKKLIYKMIENGFKQYDPDGDCLPINKSEMEKLYNRILEIKAEEPDIDLYEIVNDAIYEFVTG